MQLDHDEGRVARKSPETFRRLIGEAITLGSHVGVETNSARRRLTLDPKG